MKESEEIIVPGARDVRATLDTPDADACVVACPPHPQMGGRRTDLRLRAVSDAIDFACLRFDYGPWDNGAGELADARNALDCMRNRYDRVGLFGYSFGGCIGLLASARESVDGSPPVAVSTLAPADRITPELDAVAELKDVTCPVQVIYGHRDDTVDWEPVVEHAREFDHAVESLPADHHFVGQADKVGARVADFLEQWL